MPSSSSAAAVSLGQQQSSDSSDSSDSSGDSDEGPDQEELCRLVAEGLSDTAGDGFCDGVSPRKAFELISEAFRAFELDCAEQGVSAGADLLEIGSDVRSSARAGFHVPGSVSDRWSATLSDPDKAWTARERRVVAALRVDSENFESVLSTPPLEPEVKKRMPSGGKNAEPSTFQWFWENELIGLDKKVRSLVRMLEFQYVILNHLGVCRVGRESPDFPRVSLAASLAWRTMSGAMSLAARTVVLRRKNVLSSLSSVSPQLVTDLAGVDYGSSSLFGSKLASCIETLAGQITNEKTIKAGLSKVSGKFAGSAGKSKKKKKHSFSSKTKKSGQQQQRSQNDSVSSQPKANNKGNKRKGRKQYTPKPKRQHKGSGV